MRHCARTRATLVTVAIAAMGVCASGASAKTVDADSARNVIHKGDSLRIKLRPADSGSTGYSWRVARNPNGSVLRLRSSRTVGKHQVFVYKARRAGLTSLRLEYVSPGRPRKVAKRFANTVLVVPPEPRIGCDPAGYETRTVAESGRARVFTVRRTARILVGLSPVRIAYDAYYGCELGQGGAHPLFRVGEGEYLAPAAYQGLVVRGTVVGFEYQEGCPYNGDSCEDGWHNLVSMDLHTGKVIRAPYVGQDGPGNSNLVSGFEMSAAGGLAWIEQGREGNYVLRSDAPIEPGSTPLVAGETLDDGSEGTVEPGSLYFDGTRITWRRSGALQEASLR